MDVGAGLEIQLVGQARLFEMEGEEKFLLPPILSLDVPAPLLRITQ
jgi:hypothetical protein